MNMMIQQQCATHRILPLLALIIIALSTTNNNPNHLASSFVIPSHQTGTRTRSSTFITTSTSSTSSTKSSSVALSYLQSGPGRFSSSIVKLQSSSSTTSSSSEDGNALQALFSKECDQDGLMTKDTLKSITAIKELLDFGDLLTEELDDIWNAAPKFPDVNDSNAKIERIDVDSFIQIYRDIDDIFEEDNDDGEEEEEGDNNSKGNTSSTSIVEDDATASSTISQEEEDDGSNSDSDPQEARDEKELETVFNTICDDVKLISKASLKQWNEIQELLQEGMLGEDEFDEMWERTVKSPGSTDQLDLDGFLSFNVELDALFVFDDDDDDELLDEDTSDNSAVPVASSPPTPPKIFYADDMPPGVIFAELADDDFLLGISELQRWGELREMLDDGEILPLELQNLFDQVQKAPGTSNKLNEEGFTQLYDSIEDLFESEEDIANSLKADLLSFLNKMNNDEEAMLCGLGSLDSEMERVLNIVEELESAKSNLVLSSGGDLLPSDISGEWELLYTSSSTMKFNKGLSGLVPPNGQFGGLKQKLTASKYLADVEYIEQINAGPASFEVRVTGDWELKSSVSLFTGARSVALSVEPDKVYYGPNTTRGDHWKSLGPMNLLDITYLDENIRIMRGTTATDNIFIFKRN